MLLRDADEKHWATWLEKDRELIAKGDFYGVEHLLQAFGGMGSFNDFGLAESGKDAKLCALRNTIYDYATALKRAQG